MLVIGGGRGRSVALAARWAKHAARTLELRPSWSPSRKPEEDDERMTDAARRRPTPDGLCSSAADPAIDAEDEG
jgi:hypothetical protein